MNEHSQDPQDVIRSFAEDLVRQWLTEGVIPDDAVEASTPELRALLGAGLELSFDDFQHRHHVRPDWGFAQFMTPEFPAPFELYLPVSWSIESAAEQGVATVVDQARVRRQVLQIAEASQFEDATDGALYGGELLGFEVGREYGPFIHWRFVSRCDAGFDVWSIFSAGDHALVSLAEADDVDGLRVQLTSSVNSIPWYHWIEAQKQMTPE